MRRRLTLAAAAGAAVVLAGCGSATVHDAGATAYVAPPASVVAEGNQQATAAAPEFVSAPSSTLPSSGVAAAASPSFTVRGTTWVGKGRKVLPPVPLAAGGYRAETIVSPELDVKTKQHYACTVALSLVADGAVRWHSAPQGPGVQYSTLALAAPTVASITVAGPPGCTWTLVLVPG